MTIERLNAHQFKIVDGDKATFIHQAGNTCMIEEAVWNGDGWKVTYRDVYGMSISACEAKYGITF